MHVVYGIRLHDIYLIDVRVSYPNVTRRVAGCSDQIPYAARFIPDSVRPITLTHNRVTNHTERLFCKIIVTHKAPLKHSMTIIKMFNLVGYNDGCTPVNYFMIDKFIIVNVYYDNNYIITAYSV